MKKVFEINYTLCISIFFLFSIGTSCNKDNHEINHCLGQNETQFGFKDCSQLGPDYNMYFCDIIDLGEVELSEYSKTWIPQYCMDEGDELVFKNGEGNRTKFRILRKSHIKSVITINSFDECQQDSSKFIGHCLTNELVLLILEASVDSIQFTISLKSIPDNWEKNEGQYGDVISIMRQSENNQFTMGFMSIIDSRSLSVDKFEQQEYFNELELNGEIFEGVMSNENSHFITPHFKFYYNREYGLIGYSDIEGETWVLVRS